jgi:signal transduction histidine kinase
VDVDLWIVMGIVGAVVIVYLVTMRIFFRQSREADRNIDFTKVREWKDDDDRRGAAFGACLRAAKSGRNLTF